MREHTLRFEIETPSSRPTIHPPHHPDWEKLLPESWWRARRRARTEAAFDDWAQRVQEWEAAGRPPDRTRVYIPRTEVTFTRTERGDYEVSARALPRHSKILSITDPS